MGAQNKSLQLICYLCVGVFQNCSVLQVWNRVFPVLPGQGEGRKLQVSDASLFGGGRATFDVPMWS